MIEGMKSSLLVRGDFQWLRIRCEAMGYFLEMLLVADWFPRSQVLKVDEFD